uniref:Uncharacterized protein n=1 Tax=Romanomermis culicivorax TaxID=13658 RepID=A0A915JD50_ROMCU
MQEIEAAEMLLYNAIRMSLNFLRSFSFKILSSNLTSAACMPLGSSKISFIEQCIEESEFYIKLFINADGTIKFLAFEKLVKNVKVDWMPRGRQNFIFMVLLGWLNNSKCELVEIPCKTSDNPTTKSKHSYSSILDCGEELVVVLFSLLSTTPQLLILTRSPILGVPMILLPPNAAGREFTMLKKHLVDRINDRVTEKLTKKPCAHLYQKKGKKQKYSKSYVLAMDVVDRSELLAPDFDLLTQPPRPQMSRKNAKRLNRMPAINPTITETKAAADAAATKCSTRNETRLRCSDGDEKLLAMDMSF